jgi:hypothetical protein
MPMRTSVLVPLVLFILVSGCSRSFEVLRVSEFEEGVYITFPREAHPSEGDVLRIVGPITPEAHGRLRPILGRVRVVQVTGDTLALVKVLDGSVEKGISAEKVE